MPPRATQTSAKAKTAQTSNQHPDLLELARHLGVEEHNRLQQIETYVQEHIRQQSIEPWNQESLPMDMLHRLGELGLGALFTDGSSQLFQGLAHAALARADVSFSSIVGIHNELIVGTINTLGSL
jgi:glutaryl-CoA dehydrogenase